MIYLFSILYAIVNALYEWSFEKDIKVKDYQIFHVFSFLRNIFTITGIVYFMLNPIGNWWLLYIYLPLIAGVIYWIVFDISRNLLFREKWYHIGNGAMDRTLGKWQYVIKLILLILIIL